MPVQGQRLVYESGEWEVDLARRELRARGVPVPIGGRAFEIIEVLVQSAGELRKAKFAQYLTAFLGALAEGLAGAGRVAQGLAAIDEALARSERNEERWCVAEFLRIKGELILRKGAPKAATAAEEHFLHSLDWSRRQGALSWELRTSTSLARLQHDQGRIAEARSLLQSVYDRFNEGFETADLKTAKAYLNSLQ